jgi:hypothetical protein
MIEHYVSPTHSLVPTATRRLYREHPATPFPLSRAAFGDLDATLSILIFEVNIGGAMTAVINASI